MELLQFLRQNLDWSLLLEWIQRILAVLLCLTVHETCHGLAAYILGDPTAKSRRRLSFNPLHHIDWLGLAFMVFLGFGWAKPVPVDSHYFKNPKRGMALTALAGPTSNFLLAVIVMLCIRPLLDGTFGYGDWVFVLVYFLMDVSVLSIGLGIFNLIPIPPLDGSKVLFSLLPDRAYAMVLRYEHYGFLVLLAIMYFNVGSRFLSQVIQSVYLVLWGILVG